MCCRVSPKQKAQMVNLIKERQDNMTTLAIGDGANDVNMITAAHIGIGILGVEGRQAARASDYSIGEFSFLRRLLLVHGRESYRKNSYVVCYNFYKNVIFVIPQFWYGIVSLFCGQTLYDPWIYQFYNTFYTSLPIIWFGVFDKEVPYKILYNDSRHYIMGVVDKLFHSKRFWKWILYGAVQGFFIFLFSYYFNDVADSNGRNQDLWSIGSIVYSNIVIIVNIKILFSTNTHTVYSFLACFYSILLYWITTYFMSLYYSFENFNNFKMALSSGHFYFTTIGLIMIMVIFDVGFNRIALTFKIVKDPLTLKADEIDKNLKLSLDETTSMIEGKFRNFCKLRYFNF